MSPQPDLSVVVPVRDAAASIRPLVETILALPSVHSQVVLVDDGSVDGSTDVVMGMAAEHDQVTALAHEVSRGAGVARNQAFPHVTGRYVLFFDADDVLHGDAVTTALPLLDDTAADVAVMPYVYQRDTTGEDSPMHPPDRAIWQDAIRHGRHRVARLRDVPDLLAFTNYPWNKILRTDTYRRAGLRFGETSVHNDVLGHWYSLLLADSILLLDEVVCTHIVRATGRNLTNRHSRVRLQLFDALDETYDLLASRPADRQRYAPQYWAFAIRTSNWAADRIGPQVREAFELRRREHLQRIDLADYARLHMGVDPGLARTLARKSLL
jgi:glycosyltransferase involved in cell wall biosynthesis